MNLATPNFGDVTGFKQSINQVYFLVNMYKNEQEVQFTVIHVQGNHVHLKEHLTCKIVYVCMHLMCVFDRLMFLFFILDNVYALFYLEFRACWFIAEME